MSTNVHHDQTSSSIPLGVQNDTPLEGDENVLELRLMERFFNGSYFNFIRTSRSGFILSD